jgi:hypothetical protein
MNMEVDMRNPWEKFVPHNFGNDSNGKIANFIQVALMGIGIYFVGKKLYEAIDRFGMIRRS